MFIDEKELDLRAGKGGDGSSHFRREKFVPRGGPDGGDGGRGGDVIIKAQHDLHALNHLAHIELIAAKNGEQGGEARKTGKSSDPAIVPVPLGTVVSVITDEGEWRTKAELTEDGQEYRLLKGGNGGWGNWHFKSSIKQAPTHSNKGLPGESARARFTLKLIADVGLVGLPNAGKSTLLSVVSSAQPKIANYPFTTLEPQLGVAEVAHGREKNAVVIADLPGLIEGASSGKGLGSQFLKHVERTRTIIHCLDSSTDPETLVSNYTTVREELKNWSATLAEKPERIALTKTELVDEEWLDMCEKALSKVTSSPIYRISAVTHSGLTELLTGIDQ